ncbi:MAG: PfkB family carbohydrate kinase [Weeksellaceae bacterium]
MSLLIVGTVAFDQIESPFGKTDKILGGAATFIGLAASKLGVDSGIVSVIGGDFPERDFNLLQSKGIDLTGIEKIESGKTFYWSGRYHSNMNSRDTLVTELNVLENFQPVVPEKWKNAEVLMLGNLAPAVQMMVLNQMTRRPKMVVLDTMNFWMDHTLTDLLQVLKHVDVLTINDEEARQLSGEYGMKASAERILQMGPKILIIKRGEYGSLLFKEGEVFFAPALPLDEVVDPTGAGDTFAGGFSGYLAKTMDYSFENLKRAVIYGSTMASFTVQKFGTESLQELTDAELWERLEIFRELTRFDLD